MNKNKGFVAIELLLAAAIFGFLTVAIVGALIYGRQSTITSGEYSRASMLAEEAIEAVRNIRDANYVSLVDGTHGVSKSGGQWVLSGSSDVDDIFTRQTTISSVGSNIKEVQTTVSWDTGNITRSVNLVSRLTSWRATIIVPALWSNATLAGQIDTPGSSNGYKVATVGNFAYFVRSGGSPDFYAVNISNPDVPFVVGTLSLSGTPQNIAVSGNYAYVVNNANSAEVQVVNISNPASPTLVTSLNLSGNNNGLGIRIVGDYAYVSRAYRSGGFLGLFGPSRPEFHIINISNPTSPVLTSALDYYDDVRDLCIIGDYAYLGSDDNSREIGIVSIANKSAPTLVGTFNLSSNDNVLAMYCGQNTIFAGQRENLRAINATNPTSLTLAGSFTSVGSQDINDISLKADENLVFLATDSNSAEFQVINATNLASMNAIRTVNVNGDLTGVAYNQSLNVTPAVGQANDQEFLVFKPN